MTHLTTSDRVNEMEASSTIMIVNKAKQLKAEGKDIISLGAGEPDFDTHDSVKIKAIEAINAGFTKYTIVDGSIDLKQAVVDKLKKENGLDYSLQNISIGTGGKQVLFNLLYSTVNPGDEVIMIAPYWVSYPVIVKMVQGVPVVLNTNLENNFKASVKQLKSVITDKTKWLILNSPSNPTGAVYSKEELYEISQLLLEYPHVGVISDDIYEKIIYTQQEVFYNLAMVEPKLADRVVVINAVSKSYAMTGWRIGYGACRSENVIKAMAKVQSQTTSNPCSISQQAAVAALTTDQSYLAERCDSFHERRDFIVNYLNKIDGLSCINPEGAFYVFPSCAGVFAKKSLKGKMIKNSLDFADYLLTDYLVAVVPGIAFGAEGFFRISYVTSMDLLKEACQRIEQAVNDLI